MKYTARYEVTLLQLSPDHSLNTEALEKVEKIYTQWPET
jgi:hypothetical protein